MFAVDGDAAERFRVRIDGDEFGPVLANLALATAQARAAALDGHRTEIASIDGTIAAIERADDHFVVTPWGPASWPARCERLLAEHG